ncbi:MAG TPA: hypothetical protein VD905_00160, partial [Flavobacteriales bacterium]|nr:hypothetical protein [Flavobacteriales bacterium]
PAPYANEYYNAKGLKYACIDLNEENHAFKIDLSKPFTGKIHLNDGSAYSPEGENEMLFDLITDYGTSEHVGKDGKHNIEAYYNCWKTKYDLLKVGGVMISENPKTGNWPGHGFNYVDKNFYLRLCGFLGFDLITLEEHPAMGNTTDGWNVVCVFVKRRPDFITLEEFKTLGVKTS